MIDEKRLKTVANHAKEKGKHRNWIYHLIKAGKIEPINIDGILFIKQDKK
jgi:hypothetical protein